MTNAGVMMFLPSALLGLGVVAMLILYLGLKRDLRSQIQKQQRRIEELSAEMAKYANTAPAAPATEPQPLPKHQQPRSSLNINTRIQAMRIVRNGEAPSHIAAALGIPRGEAELLVRVCHLKSQAAAGLRPTEATN